MASRPPDQRFDSRLFLGGAVTDEHPQPAP